MPKLLAWEFKSFVGTQNSKLLSSCTKRSFNNCPGMIDKLQWINHSWMQPPTEGGSLSTHKRLIAFNFNKHSDSNLLSLILNAFLCSWNCTHELHPNIPLLRKWPIEDSLYGPLVLINEPYSLHYQVDMGTRTLAFSDTFLLNYAPHIRQHVFPFFHIFLSKVLRGRRIWVKSRSRPVIEKAAGEE